MDVEGRGGGGWGEKKKMKKIGNILAEIKIKTLDKYLIVISSLWDCFSISDETVFN